MPEVAEVGHDRTVINLKSEWLNTWLNPDPEHMDELQMAMDDPQRPYYEHALEKAAQERNGPCNAGPFAT